MILNFILLILLFGASKKKLNPYTAASILGAVKGVFYFFGTRSFWIAGLAAVIFGGLAIAMVLLLRRIDRKEEVEEPYSKYASRRPSAFKWEFIPLSGVVFLLAFGEMTANLFLVR